MQSAQRLPSFYFFFAESVATEHKTSCGSQSVDQWKDRFTECVAIVKHPPPVQALHPIIQCEALCIACFTAVGYTFWKMTNHASLFNNQVAKSVFAVIRMYANAEVCQVQGLCRGDYMICTFSRNLNVY